MANRICAARHDRCTSVVAGAAVVFFASFLIFADEALGLHALVFEAEEVTEIHGTWELRTVEKASGGAALLVGEGTGRNTGAAFVAERLSLIGSASYTIDVLTAGSYTLYGRCWSMDRCGNSCWVGFDGKRPVYFPEGRKGADDFVWEGNKYLKWLWLKLPSVTLDAGEHVLRVHVREDGFRVDQWALVPAGVETPSGILEINAHPSPPEKPWVRVYPRSHVVGAGEEVVAEVWLRRGISRAMTGRLEVTVPESVTASPQALDVSLGEDEAIRRVDVVLRHAGDFPRGEHEYRFAFTTESGGRLVSVVRISRPFPWEILAPLPDEQGEGVIGPLLGELESVPAYPPPAEWPGQSQKIRGLSGPVTWKRISDENPTAWFTPYGFLDFELACGHAENAKAYARTTVVAPETEDYLVEFLSDDEGCLWVNGERVYDNPFAEPCTDHFGRVTVRLAKGKNEVAAAVRQHGRDWQLRVRIRKPDGAISGVH